MRVIDCEQGTDEWLAVRLGRITASRFSSLVNANGSPAALGTVRRYAEELAVEEMRGRAAAEWSSDDATRGHVLEPMVIREVERIRGYRTERVGFVLRDDETCGGSPDAMVIDEPGNVEAKTKRADLHAHTILDRLRLDSPPPDHVPQCLGIAYVTDREWTDLILGSWDADMCSPIWRIVLGDAMRRVIERQVALCLELKSEALRLLRDPTLWRPREVRIDPPPPPEPKAAKGRRKPSPPTPTPTLELSR